MYKILRIVFCVLAAALAAVAIFMFVYLGWLWGLITVLATVVCGALMVTFKQLQEKQEVKSNPPPPQGDFIFGKIGENEKQDDNK